MSRKRTALPKVGTKNGRLKFIEECEPKIYGKSTTVNGKTKSYRTIVCECDCGNIIQTRLANFINGKTKSCGCASNAKKVNSICMDCQTDIGYILPLCKFLLAGQPEDDMIYKVEQSSQNDMFIVYTCPRYTGIDQNERRGI